MSMPAVIIRLYRCRKAIIASEQVWRYKASRKVAIANQQERFSRSECIEEAIFTAMEFGYRIAHYDAWNNPSERMRKDSFMVSVELTTLELIDQAEDYNNPGHVWSSLRKMERSDNEGYVPYVCLSPLIRWEIRHMDARFCLHHIQYVWKEEDCNPGGIKLNGDLDEFTGVRNIM